MSVSESYKIIERLGKQKRRKFGELFPIIQKMIGKHQFKIPTNKMTVLEVKGFLQNAIEKRHQKTDGVLKDLQKIKAERRVLPKNIFSKS
jgi:hypothetical protein